MSLYFITGVSATGKSALTHELRSREYTAYDTDDDALARWQNNETGYIHPKSSVKPEQRTAAFLEAHSWNVPREYIEKIAVFAVTIDEDTLRHRLANRTSNDWGKQSHELRQTLDAHKAASTMYRDLGYTTIDATLTTPQIADEILAQIKTSR